MHQRCSNKIFLQCADAAVAFPSSVASEMATLPGNLPQGSVRCVGSGFTFTDLHTTYYHLLHRVSPSQGAAAAGPAGGGA